MTKRLFVALLGVLLARYALAFEPFVIRDIRIEGIQRVEAGTVFGYLPVKVGETMSEDKAAQAIRALFATGLFKDVRVEVEGEVLVVVVEERPAIAQIDFVGMKDLPADQVRKALRENGIAEGRTFDKAVVDQAEQEIKRQYLSRGRYGVTVTTTVTPLDRNRVAINFTVDEGEVARIKNINIVGNRAFTEAALLDLIQLQTSGWLSWYTKNDQYSRQKLAADLETLRSYYLNRGYLDFNIESTQVSISPDKRDIYITINLTEGEKYTVTDVRLGGDLLLPESELMRLVQVKPGEPFSREKLAESTKAIAERLGNEGYAFANANAVPDVNKEKRTVAFTIMIDPGRRVYVRRINIVGNTKTRDEVVRRELRQLEGGYYDGQKLQVSRQRVDKLNYFDSVELETEPVAGSSDQVDINLKVKEKATGSLLFGVGFSSSDGVMLQGSLSQANIFGSGNSVTVSANTGKVNRNIGFSYVNPYFTVDGVSAGFNVYDRRFDAEALDVGNYVTETYGGGVQFGFPTAEFDRVAAALAWEQTKIDLFADSPPRFVDFVNQTGADPVSMPLTISWARDRRDSAIFPTTGTFQRVFTEVAIPGFDLKYYKLGYQLTWYIPITRDVIGMLNGLVGYGAGYGGQTLPFFKAYYAGGPGTVRGYDTASLGPRDPEGVTGGSRQAVANAEVTFPFPGMGQDRSLRLGAFFDAGQVWTDQPGFGFGDTGTVTNTSTGVTVSYDLRLRYSAGAIIAWNSPFGPLRLFYAVPLNSQPGDQLQRFQFIFGHTF
ncbi:MAG TPA: outer membrane protein assembly factor BamA [Burkholderiales bacterium]|nr:outer membrane protein assembly factor BamA [Burkholderiales bacterium]